MSAIAPPRVETPGFSFYLDSGRPDLIERAAAMADSVTIRGRSGPRVVEQLRRSGWQGEVMFDLAAYEKSGSSPGVDAWFEQQRLAGTRRVLSPGRWIDSSTDSKVFRQEVEDELARIDVSGGSDASPVLALHHHWLTKHAEVVASVLTDIDRPAALVLGHGGDPLSVGGAVDGLIHITKVVPGLSLLRIDQGGVGGVAFGASHASFGLRPGNRHVVPPGKPAGGKRDDRSARLFVKDKLDWFTAFRIAGWASAEVPENCDLDCCGGEPLARFLDERRARDAEYHNMVALSDVAAYIVNAGPNERRRLFAELCDRAVKQYDRLAFMNIVPKSQLQAWAIWA